MTRYQLVKLVSWVGTLDSRKREFKTVFMLQAAGCPIEADFFLHQPGVYSFDVARLPDELVHDGLLVEEAVGSSRWGEQYSYRLTEQGQEELQKRESTEEGRQLAAEMAPFEPLARLLLQADLKELEVAATMLYCRRDGDNWSAAVQWTCTFSRIPPEGSLAARAQELGQTVEASSRKTAA